MPRSSIHEIKYQTLPLPIRKKEKFETKESNQPSSSSIDALLCEIDKDVDDILQRLDRIDLSKDRTPPITDTTQSTLDPHSFIFSSLITRVKITPVTEVEYAAFHVNSSPFDVEVELSPRVAVPLHVQDRVKKHVKTQVQKLMGDKKPIPFYDIELMDFVKKA